MGRGEKREDGGKNLGPSLIGEGYTRIRGAPILPFNMVTPKRLHAIKRAQQNILKKKKKYMEGGEEK